MFPHEESALYQKSLTFIQWSLLFSCKENGNTVSSLCKRAKSLPLKIALLYNSIYSGDQKAVLTKEIFEVIIQCSSCIDILQVVNIITIEECKNGKSILKELYKNLEEVRSYNSTVREDDCSYLVE